MAIDFIFDFACRCGNGNQALDIEEFLTFSWLAIIETAMAYGLLT